MLSYEYPLENLFSNLFYYGITIPQTLSLLLTEFSTQEALTCISDQPPGITDIHLVVPYEYHMLTIQSPIPYSKFYSAHAVYYHNKELQNQSHKKTLDYL